MSWQKKSPGHFERPLDSIELFYKTVAEAITTSTREHWTVSVSARFRLNSSAGDAESALQHAWRTIRHDHPQIASFARGDVTTYETPNPKALDAWLAKTFLIEPTATADDLLASSQPSLLPTLYYLPRTSQIVIRSSHWRIDGIGAICLLNNFFAALAQPRRVEFSTEGEGKNLSPGLDEAANFSTDVSDEDDQAATDLFMQYANNLPSISLPIFSADRNPGATRRSELTLPPATTGAVVSACRDRGFTVSTALHAALIVATTQLASDDPSAKNYTSWGTFDLRPYLRSLENHFHAHPVSVYALGLPLTVTPSSFSVLAPKLRSFYKQLSLKNPLPTFLASYVRKVTAMVSQTTPADTPVPAPPVLINVGVADRYISHIYGSAVDVEYFWLATEVLTRQLTLYVWTWRDRMSFSICYNEGFYTAEFVEGFLQRVKSVLLDELSVDLY
ncbi:hypothetical protein MMC28_005193 [Mycoblastus sanguinarius]|nr:hypothetical protein [Mycoblastus sanguinarius]